MTGIIEKWCMKCLRDTNHTYPNDSPYLGGLVCLEHK